MNRTIINLLAFIFCSFLNIYTTYAQQGPGEYMSQLGAIYEPVTKDTWDYTKQVARGRNARRIDKKRTELMQTLKKEKYNASRVGTYEGDPALRDAAVNYLQYYYLILAEDYGKLIDLEDIAEQSYDDMEAYLMAKEAIDEKMDSVSESLTKETENFADKYGVNLVDSDSRIGRKLSNASEINQYYNQVYLVFFKSYYYEGQMLKAFSENNISEIEQFRQTLALTAIEGGEKLKEIGLFRMDRRLKDAAQQTLNFFQKEAKDYAEKNVAFLVQSEKFQTLTKNIEAKNPKKLTQEEVDSYNATLEDYNKAINDYNDRNARFNKLREENVKNFNKATSDFYDKHI